MSDSLAAVPSTLCTGPNAASAPMCAFMPKYHRLPFLVCLHVGIAFAFAVLGRTRRVDDRGIHQRALAHEQLALGEQCADFSKDTSGQLKLFEQVAKLQERGGIGHRLQAQIDAGEGSHRQAVVKGVLQRLVGQPVPLLEEVEAQHPLNANRWASALARRVARLDCGSMSATSLAHGTTRSISPRNFSRRVVFFFPCIHRVGKAHLSFHARERTPSGKSLLLQSNTQIKSAFA